MEDIRPSGMVCGVLGLFSRKSGFLFSKRPEKVLKNGICRENNTYPMTVPKLDRRIKVSHKEKDEAFKLSHQKFERR